MKGFDPFDPYNDPTDGQKEDAKAIQNGFCQWTKADNGISVPANFTIPRLEPAFYMIEHSNMLGTYFKKIAFGVEELLEFPDSHCDEVVRDIKKFWSLKDKYRSIGQLHKRGMLLIGVPGGGKSSAIKLIVTDIIKNGGIAIKFQDHRLFTAGIDILRRIEPDRQVVVLMEDIDGLIKDGNESEILNILDGVSHNQNIVFLATTNHPDMLLGNITNRPSRFDRVFDFKAPSAETRKIYLTHLKNGYINTNGNIELDLDKWVTDTEGMTVAHLKELFISVAIFEYNYENTLKILKGMRVKPKEDDGLEDKKVGF